MNTVTHALAPVLLMRWFAGRSGWLDRKGLILIGAAGALPDLINPHLSLEARMTSWSHGLPAWLIFSLVVVLPVSRWKRGLLPLPLAAALMMAYLFHLFCDAVSGGIDWLHPIGSHVWGSYWVDPVLWVPLDIVLILSAYWCFRGLPHLKAARGGRETR